MEDSRPDLLRLTGEEVLELVRRFHEMRMEGGFAPNLMEFPWRMPDGRTLYSRASLIAMQPMYTSLMNEDLLQSSVDIITHLQPHGAICVLFLLEIPMFSYESNPWGQVKGGFPLIDVLRRMARDSHLNSSLVTILEDPDILLDIANQILHVFSTFATIPKAQILRMTNACQDLSDAVYGMVKNKSLAEVPFEFVCSTVKFFSMLAVQNNPDNVQMEELRRWLEKALKIHPNRTDADPSILHSLYQMVLVMGLELSDKQKKSLSRETHQYVKAVSAERTCDLDGCENKDDLKQCARCKVVAYCSREHQKAAWKQHKKLCKQHAAAAPATAAGNPDGRGLGGGESGASAAGPSPGTEGGGGGDDEWGHITDGLPGWCPTNALREQFQRQEEAGADYIFVPERGATDHQMMLQDPMGQVAFGMLKRRAFETGSRSAVRSIFKWLLESSTFNKIRMGEDELQRQLRREYGEF